MSRVRFLALVVCLGLALAGAAAAWAAKHGLPAKVQLRSTKLGMILVNRRGFTVYAFTKDGPNHDAFQNIKLCIQAWPPVTSSGPPVAGAGVKPGLLGTIRLKNGRRQVTYSGHPLYTYIGDSSPGQTSFVNIRQFGGRWPALNATGDEVK